MFKLIENRMELELQTILKLISVVFFLMLYY